MLNQQAQVQDWKAKEAATAFAARQLQAANPHLVPNEGNALVTAAKNIRIELARAFPGVKFSVKSRRFSGGDAIDVRWVDGPTSKQVDEIIGRYEAGSFDGMTDSYSYRDDRAFTSAFGDAKYIHGSRDCSDAMLASVMRRIASKFGLNGRSIEQACEDWKQGRLWNALSDGGCDLGREISEALTRHTYCIAKEAA